MKVYKHVLNPSVVKKRGIRSSHIAVLFLVPATHQVQIYSSFNRFEVVYYAQTLKNDVIGPDLNNFSWKREIKINQWHGCISHKKIRFCCRRFEPSSSKIYHLFLNELHELRNAVCQAGSLASKQFKKSDQFCFIIVKIAI